MVLPPLEERRRRMRAARALAGFTNVTDLANEIPRESELGERTLRKLESGESDLRPPAMREIAAACRLPYEFFLIDFQRLPELATGDQTTGLQAQLDALRADLELLGAEVRRQSDASARPSRRQPPQAPPP